MLVLVLPLLLFALGCGMFGYWLGWIRGEREGFDTGRNYQRLKDRADSLHDSHDDGLPDWVYLN